MRFRTPSLILALLAVPALLPGAAGAQGLNVFGGIPAVGGSPPAAGTVAIAAFVNSGGRVLANGTFTPNGGSPAVEQWVVTVGSATAAGFRLILTPTKEAVSGPTMIDFDAAPGAAQASLVGAMNDTLKRPTDSFTALRLWYLCYLLRWCYDAAGTRYR